uniref:F-box domain-containing protein n=1 Tax=Leersia perrieri TaxID=77586 RepID=A0A0D9XHI5_9ORYZ
MWIVVSPYDIMALVIVLIKRFYIVQEDDAIEAGRWDGEPLLGRLVVVAHAAFLHAGFVPCAGDCRYLPDEIGAVASSLSLRYTIRELLQDKHAAAAGAETVVVRLTAVTGHVIFYGYLTGGDHPNSKWAATTYYYWVLIDASLAAPVLSSDLDATAHTLSNSNSNGGVGVRLWKGELARRLFTDICWNRAVMPPRLTSLPADLQAAILSRLNAAVDLARVQCTCTELRDLVAGRELLKGKFKKKYTQVYKP